MKLVKKTWFAVLEAVCSLGFALSLVLTAGVPGSAFAEDAPAAIGYVMTVKGTATVTTGSSTVPAAVGTPVALGSTLHVGADGALGVTMKDSTVMSLGPNSELLIEEYLFAPARNELKLTTKITHGTLNFISGVIAKLKPEAVQVKTPTGTIGVRGTHFYVKVDE